MKWSTLITAGIPGLLVATGAIAAPKTTGHFCQTYGVLTGIVEKSHQNGVDMRSLLLMSDTVDAQLRAAGPAPEHFSGTGLLLIFRATLVPVQDSPEGKDAAVYTEIASVTKECIEAAVGKTVD